MDLLEIDSLDLYFGDPYVINENISVLQPTIGDIAQYGERKYFSIVHTITAIPSDMKSQLWDLGNDVVDNSEISEFENRGQYYRSTLSMVVDEAQLIYVEKYVPVKEIQIRFIAQEVTETYPPIETIANISLPVSLEKGSKE